MPRSVGRPRSDLAFVLRNRLWGHAAYVRAGVSWDALDDKLLSLESHPDAPRPRKVWHVARLGISPCPNVTEVKTDSRGGGPDLVALADQYPEFAGLREAFASSLWKLLIPPGPNRVGRLEIQATLLTRLELYQSNYPLRQLGALTMPAEPAFRPWDGDVTRWLHQHLQSPTLDMVAVLVGGFREAMDRLELLEANSYLGAARKTLRAALQRLAPPNDLVEDIAQLVDRRLFRSEWEQPLDSSYKSKRRKRRKAPEIPLTPREILFRAISGDNIPNLYTTLKSIGENPGQAPIVPLNDELRWFHKHRAALYARCAEPVHCGTDLTFQTLRGDEEAIPRAELSKRFGLPE